MAQINHLSVLTHCPPDAVKALAEQVLEHIDTVQVLQNRTGLVMQPYTDSGEGVVFHLGEVLVSEAHVRLGDDTEGYAMCLGRDIEQAMAIAVLDAALRGGVQTEAIQGFVDEQSELQARADEDLLRNVNATRVEMETF